MRRIIPVLNISIDNPEMLDDVIDEFSKNVEIRSYIYKETLSSIQDSIRRKRKTATLFEIANTGAYIDLDQENWNDSLKKALKHFEETEEYNYCIQCRDLINKSYE